MGNDFYKTFRLILPSALAVAAAVAMTACSEDKTPPDDGGGRKAESTKTESTKTESTKAMACADNTDAFSACAENVLQSSGLTTEERISLMSCGFKNAVASTSGEDSFETARLAVAGQCY
jgi:hypothetical protein